MTGFLLDTNVCIQFFKKDARVAARIEESSPGTLFISEIILTELRIGALKSQRPEFHNEVRVLPITPALDLFANEKVRLGRAGSIIDNFDLLIGATSIHHDLTLITNNTKHFQRLAGIRLQDWTK